MINAERVSRLNTFELLSFKTVAPWAFPVGYRITFLEMTNGTSEFWNLEKIVMTITRCRK